MISHIELLGFRRLAEQDFAWIDGLTVADLLTSSSPSPVTLL
jgi:hypothetical protein